MHPLAVITISTRLSSLALKELGILQTEVYIRAIFIIAAITEHAFHDLEGWGMIYRKLVLGIGASGVGTITVGKVAAANAVVAGNRPTDIA